ncbi:MAG: cell wall hydrolase [Bacteroidales bacterium]|nr:cell wall hydrolase [Bacteroidales bacterium]
MAKYVKKKKNYLINIQIAVVFLLILIIVVMITSATQKAKYEKQIVEINTNHEAEMEALKDELYNDYVSQMAELKQYYEYGGDISQIEREAEYIAKVIYGTARNHSDSDKRAVVWCILNRVEHYAHPDTVAEVCEQPKQWMGYSSDNPVLDDIYDLALTELKIWHSDGHRPMSNDYIYLSWSSNEIILRNTFEESKNTKYWRMK